MTTILGKSKQYLLLVFILNLGAAAVLAFLFMEVKAANERISSLANDIELRSKQEGALRSVKDLVAETTVPRQDLETYFVEKEGVVAFLELLETVGKSAGVVVTIQTVEERTLEGSDSLEELHIKLDAIGSWEDVIHFLGLLEYLPYESDMGQVVISRKDAALWRLDAGVRALKIRS